MGLPYHQCRNTRLVHHLRSKPVLDSIQSLLKQINAYSDLATTVKALEAPTDWTLNARELTAMLVPNEIQEVLDPKRELVIVPHGQLWILPFELLVDKQGTLNDSWAAKFKLSYALTPLTAGFDAASLLSSERLLLLSKPNFFSVESEIDSQLSAELIKALPAPKTTAITLSKENTTNYPFPVIASEMTIIASDLALTNTTAQRSSGQKIKHFHYARCHSLK